MTTMGRQNLWNISALVKTTALDSVCSYVPTIQPESVRFYSEEDNKGCSGRSLSDLTFV